MSSNRPETARAAALERLTALAADPRGVELVAALVHGSRATFTVAEAAVLLAVSPKHLYARAAASGEVAPGVLVLRSGDRLAVPAHLLRARIGLPDPHRVPTSAEPLVIEHLPPRVLQLVAELVSHAALVRMEAAGLYELPERLSNPPKAAHA